MGTFNSVLNVIKIGIFLIIIVVAFLNFKLENITPIVSEDQGYEGII